jgi:hypothetical protein
MKHELTFNRDAISGGTYEVSIIFNSIKDAEKARDYIDLTESYIDPDDPAYSIHNCNDFRIKEYKEPPSYSYREWLASLNGRGI